MRRQSLLRTAFLIACALARASPLCAQGPLLNWISDGPERAAANDSFLQTDGPTFTRASSTVPFEMVQLETRYLYSARPTLNSFPQSILRIGLLPRAELRAEWVGVDSGPGLRSSEDLEVGFKFAVTKNRGWIPETALVAEVLAPTGYGPKSIGTPAPEIDYIYSWSLTDALSFGGGTGAIFGQPAAANVTQFYQSLVVTQTWAAGHVVTAYECYSLFGSDANQGAVLPSLDGALLLRPTKNLQFDWRVGLGLNQQATAFFTGAGVSARY